MVNIFITLTPSMATRIETITGQLELQWLSKFGKRTCKKLKFPNKINEWRKLRGKCSTSVTPFKLTDNCFE